MVIKCKHEDFNDSEEYFFCNRYGDLDFETCKKEDNCECWEEEL